ncbi:MAG: peroxiredoxin [Planctomycetota bacterium]|nr:peroxiredoxin [Planctomycetota bacterium]
MRATLRVGVLVLCVLAAACAGDDSTLTLLRIGPVEGIPQTLDATLIIIGRGFPSGNMTLEVMGVGSFSCELKGAATALCFVPANTLPAGTYDVLLKDGTRASDMQPGMLVVNPQPVLNTTSQDVFDPNFNLPFQIGGSGFTAPVDILFLDGLGAPLAAPRAAQVQTGGTVLAATSPIVPGVGGPLAVTIQIRNGDGQSAFAAMPVTLSSPEPGVRTIDGSGNNIGRPTVGSANIRLRRAVGVDYADGVSSPSGATRPSARAISNAVSSQLFVQPNAARASDYLWQWGQFLDHDIDLTPGADPTETFDIEVPTGDLFFDPLSFGGILIPLNRSTYDPASGTVSSNPREQLNKITAFVDASNVYGSDAARAAELRTGDGTGRLRTTTGNYLPFNGNGFPNAPTDADPMLFLAGDVRANEHVGLTALHTLFLREHNRLADEIRADNPGLSGEDIYQAARRWVGAQLQVITVKEFLPVLLGPGVLPAYAGYQPTVDPGISNLFSTACYRFGHTQVSGRLMRLDASGFEIPQGHLALRDAFFQPARIRTEGGIDPILRGLAAQPAQEVDLLIVDDLRSFLFGPPGAGGLDLAALNIQRGRDHGLPSYNQCRVRMGLAPKTSFADVTSDAALQTALAGEYATVDAIDAWVGGLAEDHRPGAMVGELLWTVLRDQFQRLRDGDRFWYERVFTGAALAELESTTLADIIRRNTGILAELQNDVFRVP